MKRFIEEADRSQWTLLPESLDDWISEDNPVRAIDAFVDALDLAELGFKAEPAATGRPSFRPSVHVKLYIYGMSTGCSRAAVSNVKRAATSK
jgi:transposase